jgi:hypothetical protein
MEALGLGRVVPPGRVWQGMPVTTTIWEIWQVTTPAVTNPVMLMALLEVPQVWQYQLWGFKLGVYGNVFNMNFQIWLLIEKYFQFLKLLTFRQKFT